MMINAIFSVIYLIVIVITILLTSRQFKYEIKFFEEIVEEQVEKVKKASMQGTVLDLLGGNRRKVNPVLSPDLPYTNPCPVIPGCETSLGNDQRDNGTIDEETIEMEDKDKEKVRKPGLEKRFSIVPLPQESINDVVDFGRLNTNLTLDQMCKKLKVADRSKSLYQKSNLYMGGLALMSIFYSLAVLQLAFQAADKQKKEENNDICYYNGLCQNPWKVFLDFNHFFSNLGYVVFGIVFIMIVYFKQSRYERLKQDPSHVANMHGIPHQYGIYYTLGGALAMEGIMSASYHVCPTNISFQFDTTFMYLLAILMYIKLYQNRHPDISSNAVQVVFVVKCVICVPRGFVW